MNRILISILIIFITIPYASIAQENFLIFLNDEFDATNARIKIINEAEKEILISYFIFEDDPIGLIGLDLLLLKKEQNPDLEIKLLLDASSNRVDKSILYYMEQKGIEIKEFHPLPKLLVPLNKISIKNFFRALRNYNFRMHDKLIIVDNKKLIAGGRNVEKSYYGLDSKNFHDRDFFFHSEKLANEVNKYFHLLWNSKHVKSITYTKRDREGKNRNKMVYKILNIRKYIEFQKENFEKVSKFLNPRDYGIKFDKVTFLSAYNEATGKFNPYFLSTALFNLTIRLKKSMLIETPYLLPTKRFYKLLERLKENKINMEFVTNSFCSTDVMPVAAAYDNEKPKLHELGVDIYEYIGPDYLHAKSAVFDDSLALVGSYNIDPRSAYINTELVFIIDDKNIAKKLKKIIYEDRENCVKVRYDENKNLQGYYDCTKSKSDMMIYLMFKYLTNWKWLYNLF